MKSIPAGLTVYTRPAAEEHVLSPDLHGVAPPEVRHDVRPEDRVRFFVEFLRQDPA